MDKKNQSNKSVGDDPNLSHENQLTPTWENISQELNALDGESMPINEPFIDNEESPDVADFSAIKTGFEANFSAKEPPKFMWDKIEQDLESFTITDAPSDFSAIKTGFEQNYKKAAIPNFTWADLAEEMDNPKPKEEVEDYTFVKRGFEKQYSAVVVPLFSWADLAQRMDHEAALADTPERYSVIKESFQKEYAAQQPSADTWAALNQQLQSQTHWKKALLLLSAPSFLKKAALFVAIGVFILGSKLYLSNPRVKTPSIIASAQNGDKQDKKASIFDKIKENKDSRSHTTEKVENEVKDQSTVINRDEINRALLFSKNKGSSTNVKIKQASKRAFTPSEIANSNAVVQDKNKLPYHLNNLSTSLSNNSTDSKSAANESLVLDKETKSSIRKQAALEQEDVLRSNLKLLANHSNTNWIGQEVMDIELLDDGLGVLIQKIVSDKSMDKMEESNFTLVRQAQKGKKIRFEIGLVGRGGTSILLGQNTYDAWNGGNTLATQLCPTGSFGILANYHFNLNDALVLGLYPYSTMQQYFGAYNNDGTFETTKINLSLVDITLGYQRTLIHYNSLSQVPSKIYARLDLGLGILTHAKTSINEQLVNTESLYNKFNFSVGFALGNTHEFKQFVFDYGITGSLGLNNLVTTANATILKPAKLLNVGAYIGLRYIISQRLEPSKKQRQFDWSPPFYIEEPAF